MPPADHQQETKVLTADRTLQPGRVGVSRGSIPPLAIVAADNPGATNADLSRLGFAQGSAWAGALPVVVSIAAAALWTQLELIPTLGSALALDFVGFVSLAIAGLSLVCVITAVAIASQRPSVAVGLLLGGFPCLLGLFAAIAGAKLVARFDTPARILSALTAVIFVVTTLRWAQTLSPVQNVTLAVSPPSVGRPPPKLQKWAFGLIAAMGFFLAVVAPAWIATHSSRSSLELVLGDRIHRAREAITAAGGLCIGLAVVLGPGASLARNPPPKQRRYTRALAFFLWAATLAGLRVLLNRP